MTPPIATTSSAPTTSGTIFFISAPPVFDSSLGGVIAWTPSTEAAPPSCESKCDKQYQKCLRQGNDPGFCYDLVFCECMCNVCDNCVC